MFVRRTDPEPVPAQETPQALPAWRHPLDNRGRVSARKDEPPTIVSFGTRTVAVEDPRTRKPVLVEYEAGCDKAHPSRLYYRRAGSNAAWTPVHVATHPDDGVQDRFTIPRRRGGHVSANFPAARPDEIIRLPPVSAEERAVTRVMFGTSDR